MHGGTTAIFAIAGKTLPSRRGLPRGPAGAAALAVAVTIHSAFNHFFLSPVLSDGLHSGLVAAADLRRVRAGEGLEEWLNVGFDADTEVLELILAGTPSGSPVGTYLRSLKERFRGEVVVDMLCYLRLHLELSLRQGLLMMREAEFSGRTDRRRPANLVGSTSWSTASARPGSWPWRRSCERVSRDLWQISHDEDEAARS
jgi:hypothetical protein